MPRIVVTEQEWLEIGLSRLADQGVDGLNVEEMSRALGCSKSSFYWYFGGRRAFLEKVVALWVERATRELIAETEDLHYPPERFRSLIIRVFQEKNGRDLLFHLRKLGESEHAFHERLAAVEEERISYLTALLGAFGWEPEPARERAELIYHYYLGWYERHKYQVTSCEEAERQADRLFRTLVQRPQRMKQEG